MLIHPGVDDDQEQNKQSDWTKQTQSFAADTFKSHATTAVTGIRYLLAKPMVLLNVDTIGIILFLMFVVNIVGGSGVNVLNVQLLPNLANHKKINKSYYTSVLLLMSLSMPFAMGEYLIETIESPHPYKNSQQLSGTFAMTPSSVTSAGDPPCLRVTIDSRSATEKNYDYFGITGPGDTNTVLSLDGSFGQVKEHQHFDVLRASTVAWSFSSDGGVTMWGYKVSVMPCNQCPIGHAKTTTSLASIIDVDRHCKLCDVGFYDPGGTTGSW